MTERTDARSLAGQGMVLRSTLTSPFGRKARIAAKVLKLEASLELVVANTLDENDSLRQQNPLGKMPALLLADGTILYDSTVIIEFFDSLGETPRLLPPAGLARYAAMTRATLANGITDAALLMVYEGRFREAEKISGRWLDHQRGKVFRGLDVIAAALPDPAQTDLVSISLACALSYLDWRRPVEWRAGYPALVGWLERFALNEPAYLATARPEGD